MKKLLFIFLFSLTSCKLVDNEENLSVHPVYVQYWIEVQNCSNNQNPILLTNIKFNVVDDNVGIANKDLSNLHALWRGSYDVDIERLYKFDSKTVKHVMLHVIKQNRLHEIEFTNCGV